jgi:hypothetical protein
MKTLREIESTIFKTDCKECIRYGWNRSQPILTKDENGSLIDNFFSYAENITSDSFSTPLVVFGIYAEEPKTAYKNWIPKEEHKTIKNPNGPVEGASVSKAYARYEEIYPEVRECAFSDNCTDEQKAMVKEYVSCLEKFSGPVVWKYYLELFPSFFEWADSLG